MAGKKPAKAMAGKGQVHAQDPAIYGSPLRYVGMKGMSATCGKCGKQTTRGMVRSKGDSLYCSALCASLSN